jgi:hypothetical protein
MALFRLQINRISRSAGRSAPAAAAYRAGERIRDERTGVLHNYSRRRDVSHTEIFLPSALAAGEAGWARDRTRLWNAAEAAERRRDSRVAREYQVALPAELSAAQRLELARRFSRELADRHNVAVDLAMHDPRPGSDPRNYHAHLLATTREVGAAGLGAKTGIDMAYPERVKRGLHSGLDEMVAIRERWATLSNEAFRSAGLDLRVDHRSLKAQGIDREPMPQIPYAAYQMERRGQHSEVAERIRERYRQRVTSRGASALTGADAGEHSPAPLARDASGLEELRRRSREAWLQLRREAVQPASAQPSASQALQASRQKGADRSASASAAASESRHDSIDKDFSL